MANSSVILMKPRKRKENSLIMLNYNQQKSLLLVIISFLITCNSCLLLFSQAAPTDIQPANQMPQLQQPLPQQINNQPSSSIDTQNSQSSSLTSPQAPQRLPNINIYINRQEIKKLLGIDSKINYVTNGNIDTYPFGFTIPLGYNQTDMIFTWQNLGQTNVNYSISLIIGNLAAVEAPLINITRSGLIPQHEQVFKITLPCSGKMSVEVDFQILMNITGYVSSDDSNDFQQRVGAPDPSGVLGQQAAGSMGSAVASGQLTGSEDRDNSDQPAAAAQAEDQMQSDQTTTTASDQLTSNPSSSSSSKLRLVSHTLVLNRKKICTVHPVPVPVQPPTTRTTSPPQQQQQQQQHQWRPNPPFFLASTTSTVAPLGSSVGSQTWTANTISRDNNNNNNNQRTSSAAQAAVPNQSRFNLAPPAQVNEPPVRTPFDNNNYNNGEPSTRNHSPVTNDNAPIDHLEQITSVLSKVNLIPSTPPEATQTPKRPFSQQEWPDMGYGLGMGRNQQRANQDHFSYPNWPQSKGTQEKRKPFNQINDIDIATNRIIINPYQQQVSQQSAGSNNSPLVFILFGLSFLVFIALIVVFLGSSTAPLRRGPLDKLTSLTSNILRRTPASMRHNANNPKKPPSGLVVTSAAANAGSLISSFRIGPKSSQASSMSGLSGISGNHFANNNSNKSHHLYNNNKINYTTGNGYYTTGGHNHHNNNSNNNSNHHHQHHHYQYQQQYSTATLNHNNSNNNHHYQHPPTADLLGTGYQCQPTITSPGAAGQQQQQPPLPPPQYPIHHIATGNNNQTTRLIWNNGNGTSPDGFTIDGGSYMPLSNAPRSDNGSVYQTIY